MIFDEQHPPANQLMIIDPLDFTRRKRIALSAPSEDLLVPIFKQGQLVYDTPDPSQTKTRVAGQLSHLHPTIKRLLNPHQYPVGLEQGLHKFRTELILKTRDEECRDRAEVIDSLWQSSSDG